MTDSIAETLSYIEHPDQTFYSKEIFWAVFALLLLFLTLFQFYQERRNIIHYVFFLLAFFGYISLLCYGSVGVYAYSTSGSMFYLQVPQNYLSALGVVLIEMSFASMVLLVRQIHRLLRLKNKRTEYLFIFLSGVHILVNIGVVVYQNSFETRKYLLFQTHVVNFIFSVINLTVYTTMYISFRCYVLKTREISLTVAIQTSALCRNFGWFIVLYVMLVIAYGGMAVACFIEYFGNFNESTVLIIDWSISVGTAVRFFCFAMASILFHPPWAKAIDSVYNKEMLETFSYNCTYSFNQDHNLSHQNNLHSNNFNQQSSQTSQPNNSDQTGSSPQLSQKVRSGNSQYNQNSHTSSHNNNDTDNDNDQYRSLNNALYFNDRNNYDHEKNNRHSCGDFLKGVNEYQCMDNDAITASEFVEVLQNNELESEKENVVIMQTA